MIRVKMFITLDIDEDDVDGADVKTIRTIAE